MATTQDSYPLTQNDLAKINTVLDSCNSTQAVIDKCKASGLDVSQAEAENTSQRKLMEDMKRSFFPSSP